MEDRAGCQKCNMTGWVLNVGKDGQPKARPCKCLYEVAKRSKESAEEIIKAYEDHNKKEE